MQGHVKKYCMLCKGGYNLQFLCHHQQKQNVIAIHPRKKLILTRQVTGSTGGHVYCWQATATTRAVRTG